MLLDNYGFYLREAIALFISSNSVLYLVISFSILFNSFFVFSAFDSPIAIAFSELNGLDSNNLFAMSSSFDNFCLLFSYSEIYFSSSVFLCSNLSILQLYISLLFLHYQDWSFFQD